MFRFAGLLFAMVLSQSAGVAGTPPDQRLRGFLEGLSTLQADFDQTVVAAGQTQPIRSHGRFYLSRPNRFRWDYTDPAGQQVIADGSRVWLYDAELAQVSHQSQSEALRGTPALLLSGEDALEKHFEIVGLSGTGDSDWVELVPKGAESEVSSIRVAFERGTLKELEMVDAFGQVTAFQLRKVQRNPTLDPALFRFVPPPDVDLLGR